MRKNTTCSFIGLFIVFTIFLSSCNFKQKNDKNNPPKENFQTLTENLLKDWCDGMLAVQINNKDSVEIDGALGCPACNKIHGRCMDAVYPFMHMAHITGETKYLNAAKSVMKWSDNVSLPNGAWTVIPNPKSWKGITVFGAIALAEALHYHGEILDKETYSAWMKRLELAGEYVYNTFDMTFTNINYGYTAVYALNLIGGVLNRPDFIDRSKELAKEIPKFFTSPNCLLFGEGKPSNIRSAKGLLAVDLGYNVEESLNGVVQYAIHEKDEELLKLLQETLESHLEFMLPDGAWDNGWGTRMFKWSYWGSRTTDGSQLAYGLMAYRNPEFETAVIRTTELLNYCTSEGLLHGGPHYVSHGVKPCVHHTFAHAKVLASILDSDLDLTQFETDEKLPREKAEGVKEFPEIATWLVSKGDYKATVTCYDAIYTKEAQQATGGSLALLYHNKVGPLFTASMAKYRLVEFNNQQPQPGIEFALTPRVENFIENVWYTNLYDLKADVSYTETSESISFEVNTNIHNSKYELAENNSSNYNISYTISDTNVEITASPSESTHTGNKASLVLPLISQTGEKIKMVSENKLELHKQNGIVVLEANVPILIEKTEKSRIFNMVPGVEAIPIKLYFDDSKIKRIICKIVVLAE